MPPPTGGRSLRSRQQRSRQQRGTGAVLGSPVGRSRVDPADGLWRYDHIGDGYARHRRADPRIAGRISTALGDARRVVDVGAGTGSYEPPDREVVAVEPSRVMLDQRRSPRPRRDDRRPWRGRPGRSSPGSTATVRGLAEALPFPDMSFDASMAVLTVHHWSDKATGLTELRRVAPRRLVLCFDAAREHDFWLVRDYLPEIASLDYGAPFSPEQVAQVIEAERIEVVPVPWDCADGFLGAYWRRPDRYLDESVRACISGIARLPADVVGGAMRRLREDLEAGRWAERHAQLQDLPELDLGYRLVVSG